MNKKIALGFRPAVSTFTKVTDILTFGKHKGHTIEWVIENDPEYILWLDDEKVAKVSEEIYKMAEECIDWEEYFVFPDPYDMYGDDD